MKKTILIVAAALALASCGGNARKKTVATDKATTVAGAPGKAQAPDMHTAETSLDYEGTYTGTFPAADCPGIEMTLRLKADGRYDLRMKYIDRETRSEEKGEYRIEDNLLTLTSDNGREISYYKVGENQLRRLDADKQPVTGALAEQYVLKKKTRE